MQSLQSQLKVLEASATSPLALVPLARQLLELVSFSVKSDSNTFRNRFFI